MDIFEYSRTKKPKTEKCIVALGFFDGVHSAHRELIGRAVALARDEGCRAAVFTFPSESEALKNSAPRIYSTKEKLSLFKKLSVDAVILADFDAIADITPEDFVGRVLIDDLDCKVAVAGYNFRFGRGAAGNSERLSELMQRHGRDALIIDEYKYNGMPLSSTAIRGSLSLGDMERAAKMLGGAYKISGEVIRGLGMGHAFGFPTVNTAIPKGMAQPRCGVYRTLVPIDGALYTGVTNIGSCPTFDRREVHAETYIVDFNGDLYGRELEIYFLEFLREERRFPDKDALVEQIKIDTERAKERNKRDLECGKWTEIGQS